MANRKQNAQAQQQNKVQNPFGNDQGSQYSGGGQSNNEMFNFMENPVIKDNHVNEQISKPKLQNPFADFSQDNSQANQPNGAQNPLNNNNPFENQ